MYKEKAQLIFASFRTAAEAPTKTATTTIKTTTIAITSTIAGPTAAMATIAKTQNESYL